MRKDQILVEWYCGRETNEEECCCITETVELIIEWDLQVCYMICPRCDSELSQRNDEPIVKERGKKKDGRENDEKKGRELGSGFWPDSFINSDLAPAIETEAIRQGRSKAVASSDDGESSVGRSGSSQTSREPFRGFSS